MSAGQPNWQRLAEINRLPQNQKDKVPLLAQVQNLEEIINGLESDLKLMHSLLTPDQKKEFHMTKKGEKVLPKVEELNVGN